MEAVVCYRLDCTVPDIGRDVREKRENGNSSIMGKKFLCEKEAVGCRFVQENPKGRGCLADVREVVDNTRKHKFYTNAIRKFLNEIDD